MSRRGVVVLLATVLTLGLMAPGLAPAAIAGTDTAAETALLGLLNQRRESVDLPALTVSGDLVEVARSQSVRMADGADLHHNPRLTEDVSGWQKVGENVGRGPSAQAIHDAFLASPSHDANLVEPDWLQVGIGVEERDGRLWVTQVFRQPADAAEPATQVAGVATEVPAPDSSTPPAAEPAAPAPEQPAAAAPAPAAPVTDEVTAPSTRTDRTAVVLARTEALDGEDLASILGDTW